jgi:hypothetical protein
VQWPPRAGELLPNAIGAWCTHTKLTDWVLSEEGHESEWERIFHVTDVDIDLVWNSIFQGVQATPVTAVREKHTGVSCEVLLELRINKRVAFVVTAWHYADAGAAPRLVTAYPKPYNRGNGSYA